MLTLTRTPIQFQTRDAGVAVEPSIVMADSPAIKDEAYALRYHAYRRHDAIPEYPSRRFSDPFDLEPNSMTYLLRGRDAKPLGSIRASLYLPGHGYELPSFETYRDEIASQIGFDQRIVESSRFVTADTSFDVMLDTQFRLYRMIWANAFFHGVDWVITAMRRKHVALYRRIIGCQVLSEPKPYYGLKDNVQMVLCGTPKQRFAEGLEKQPRLAIDLAEASWYAL